MKTIQEKTDFFLQLVQCNYNLELNSFTPDFLFSQDASQSSAAKDDDILIALNLAKPLRKHLESGARNPLLIDDALDLIWIAAFEYDEDRLAGIHVLGPAYSGRNSYQTLRKKLDERNLSVSIRAKIFRYFEHIPIVPTGQLYQYALMLHYCVSGIKISQNDLHFSSENTKSPSHGPVSDLEDHRGIWLAEQNFVNMLREGNPNYMEALSLSHSLSSGPHFETESSLRKAKSTAIVLLTLCSRAAIDGGLSPAVSYSLNDYYMQMIEDSEKISAVSDTCNTLLEDYVARVRAEKEKFSMSGQIRSACEYISLHIREKISITQLAEQTGYTEYYFSHKFKKETGLSISDYIRREKIRQAKILLAGTKMSIQEITEELSFGSRTYFSQSFQKETGMSPKEYRSRNTKL